MSLDLDDWDTFTGYGSTDGPKCPKCGKLNPQQIDRMHGVEKCVYCGQAFRWSAGPTPLGYAWQTWMPERKEGAN